jgi:hypothetical protein
MLRKIAVLCAAALFTAGTLYAQETGLGAGVVEISAFPGGGLIFQESGSGSEPDFANYAIGGSLTVNMNRYFGLEGEVGGSFGIKQNLSTVDGVLLKEKTPNTWLYMGNVVISPVGNDREAVPYITGGIGGLTLLDVTGEQAPVTGLTQNQSYLTTNLGGGLKWFASRHVGLRTDYRFIMVNNSDVNNGESETTPAFFGRETRWGHRVYAGLLLTY